jgi:hypothetical protein
VSSSNTIWPTAHWIAAHFLYARAHPSPPHTCPTTPAAGSAQEHRLSPCMSAQRSPQGRDYNNNLRSTDPVHATHQLRAPFWREIWRQAAASFPPRPPPRPTRLAAYHLFFFLRPKTLTSAPPRRYARANRPTGSPSPDQEAYGRRRRRRWRRSAGSSWTRRRRGWRTSSLSSSNGESAAAACFAAISRASSLRGSIPPV